MIIETKLKIKSGKPALELYSLLLELRDAEVMVMCHRLSREVVPEAYSGALFDALVDHVIPELIVRVRPGPRRLPSGKIDWGSKYRRPRETHVGGILIREQFDVL